ncbi:hypothetical protein TrCOL_g3744 [Triparma columacea]|uniref:COG complex component COG2 C-terminal domain-containing protein n=1 Tax=Triparma columacea TaxID=722753 RepID=A0A9W7GQJ7_9STRA|nr:hypothetical protein TrCOL_g3744 [Triparma columacea]
MSSVLTLLQVWSHPLKKLCTLWGSRDSLISETLGVALTKVMTGGGVRSTLMGTTESDVWRDGYLAVKEFQMEVNGMYGNKGGEGAMKGFGKGVYAGMVGRDIKRGIEGLIQDGEKGIKDGEIWGGMIVEVFKKAVEEERWIEEEGGGIVRGVLMAGGRVREWLRKRQGTEIGLGEEAVAADVIGKGWEIWGGELMERTGRGGEEHVKAVVEETEKEWEVLRGECWNKVKDKFMERAKERMQQIQGIAGVYRMTNRPMPSTPSPWVVGLSVTLCSFHSLHRGLVSRVWIEGLIGGVCDEVMEEISKCVDGVKKSQAIMDRRRGVTGGEGIKKRETDLDKVKRQCKIDVGDMVKGWEELGVGGDEWGDGGMEKVKCVMDMVEEW